VIAPEKFKTRSKREKATPMTAPAPDYENDNHYTDKRIPLPKSQDPAYIVTTEWAAENSYAIDRYVEMRVMGYPRTEAASIALKLSDICGIDWKSTRYGVIGQSPLERIALAVELNKECRRRMANAIENMDISVAWSRQRGTLALLDLLNSDASHEVKLRCIESLNAITLGTPLPADLQRKIVATISATKPDWLIGYDENGNAPGRPETPRARSRWKPSKH
jgi:hypothetical protein